MLAGALSETGTWTLNVCVVEVTAEPIGRVSHPLRTGLQVSVTDATPPVSAAVTMTTSVWPGMASVPGAGDVSATIGDTPSRTARPSVAGALRLPAVSMAAA